MRLTADLARGFGPGALVVADDVRPVDGHALTAPPQLIVHEIAARHAEERRMLHRVVVDDEAASGVHLGDPGPGEGVGVAQLDGLAVDGGVHGQLGVHAFDARLAVGPAHRDHQRSRRAVREVNGKHQREPQQPRA